jgi:GWxTD domain-containing protein
MRIRNFLIASAFIAATAAPGVAQVTAAKAEWAKGPVQFLLTAEEKAMWQKLPSDDAALAFIDLFWARRDPTPNTPQNEYREEFEQKVKFADQSFKQGRTRGSLTDRGKIFVLFGPPTKQTKAGGRQSQSAFEDESAATGSTTNEARLTWVYEGDAAQKVFAANRADFLFVDQFNSGDFRLTNSRVDINGAQQRVIAASITQPNLTQAPTYGKPAAAAAPQGTPAAAATPSDAFKTPAFETAVTEAKAKPAKNINLTYVELVSPTGEPYVPMQVYVPASSGLAADAADTIFGVIEDSTGKRVTVFEEPAKLTASKGDFFADRTVTLPAGKYTATVGLAKAGTPVAVTTTTLDVTAPAKDAVGVSKLVLTENIYELEKAEPVKAPYAFGKLKVVPKGNLAFTNQAELGYFVEVNNPGIDSASNMPKLQYKLDLIGPDKKAISAPLTDVQALPLSGQPGPGYYAIVSTIPLGEMKPLLKPGDYTLKMKIVDTVTKQSYTVEQPFKLTAGS